MTDTYFKSLLYRHGELQSEIDREMRGANPNWMRVLKLKKLRLALKDRLHRLMQSTAASASGPRSGGQRSGGQGSGRMSSPSVSISAQGH
jgi:uncharacterized protein YdcH (DUF465 family)